MRMKNMKKAAAIAAAVLAVLAAALAATAAKHGKGEREETPVTVYDHSPEERQLADAVKSYLEGYLVLEEAQSMAVADTAVKCYRTVLSSGIGTVTEGHTKALSGRMRDALEQAVGTESITGEGLDALADGTCGVIWDFILARMGEGEYTEQEEFAQLSESLQEQIDELKEKNMSVKISANIKDKGISRAELEKELENSGQDILSQVGGRILELEDGIWKELDRRFGNIQNGKDGSDGKDGEKGRDGSNGKDGEKGRDGSDGKDGEKGRDGSDGKDGENGKDGRDGRDGKDGSDGKDGENGKDGSDGKDGADGSDGESVYVMFSEYPGGRDPAGAVSMEPTQNNMTKYMGTAHSAEKTAPQEPEAYAWSEYKDYIIYVEPDEDGVPTLYIK